MPYTAKDKKIKGNMEKEYGPDKGEKVFFASANKGTLGKDVKERHGSAAKAKRAKPTLPNHGKTSFYK